MKKIKAVNEIMLSIVLMLSIFSLININFSEDNHYDLNNDNQVDSLDMLILRKYILENNES